MSKKKTVMLGSICGIINILLSAIGAIVVRKFFVSTLGNEYLGLTAIFSSILGLLLSMDCGVSGSLFYKIYKPLAENDEKGVSITFKLIKTVYLFRAIIIACVGLVAMFFLPELCKSSSIDLSYVYKAYGIYLILTSISDYIILYSFLLEALQKRYIVSLISVITYFISIVLQITFLLSIKSYLIYLTIGILQPIILYFICYFIARKNYPYVFGREKLKKEDLHELPQYLKMAIHTLGMVVASYTDTFLITAFTNIATLGLYDNYKVISTKVSSLLDQITSSIKDPMRLLIAEGDKNKVEETLDNINFFIFVMAGLASLIFLALITPFVSLWLGREYILSYAIAGTAAYNIFLTALNYITVDTYYYVGCFKSDKISPVIEIFVNLGLSFILGKMIGIAGVLIGTVFYYFIQEVLRSKRLFGMFWGKACDKYLNKYFIYAFLELLFILLDILFQIKFMSNVSPIIEMFVNFCFVSICFIGCIVLLYRKSSSYLYFKKVSIGFFNKFRKHM